MDDATLAQRQADKKINDTMVAGQKAMAEVSTMDPEVNRTCAQSLRTIAASGTVASGASSSQKAAMSLIASQLYMQAALLDAAMIEPLVQVQRNEADNVILFGSLSKQFKLLAKTSIQEVPAESRDILKKDFDASAQTIAVLTAQTEKLKVIIDEAKSNIAKHERDAMQLEKQASALQQKAATAGPIDGFKLTVESQNTLNNSRKLHSQSANIDLNTQNAELDNRISAKSKDAYQSSLDRNTAGVAALEAIDAQHKASVKELEILAQRYYDAAITAATSLRACDEKLNPLYDAAIESLEKAASLAQQGTSGGGEMAKGAKNALISANLSLAAMLEHRAGGSALQISGYAAAANLDDAGSWSKDAAAAQTIRLATTAKAVEAFESVLSGLPEGGGDDNAMKFRKGIELAKANYSGTKPPSDAADPVKSDADSSTPPQSPAVDGVKNDGKDAENDAPDSAKIDAAKAQDPASDPGNSPPADPPATDPGNSPPADPPATDPGNSPPADPPATDPGNSPPADPPATDPGNSPPADPPATDPGNSPPADPPATDPGNSPPADPPTDPPAAPPA